MARTSFIKHSPEQQHVVLTAGQLREMTESNQQDEIRPDRKSSGDQSRGESRWKEDKRSSHGHFLEDMKIDKEDRHEDCCVQGISQG